MQCTAHQFNQSNEELSDQCNDQYNDRTGISQVISASARTVITMVLKVQLSVRDRQE